jgi:hypothetical protein
MLLVRISTSAYFPVTSSVCLNINLVRIRITRSFNWLNFNPNLSEMPPFKDFDAYPGCGAASRRI